MKFQLEPQPEAEPIDAATKAALDEARAQIARGECYTLDEVRQASQTAVTGTAQEPARRKKPALIKRAFLRLFDFREQGAVAFFRQIIAEQPEQQRGKIGVSLRALQHDRAR